jgi:hypothetical protein
LLLNLAATLHAAPIGLLVHFGGQIPPRAQFLGLAIQRQRLIWSHWGR